STLHVRTSRRSRRDPLRPELTSDAPGRRHRRSRHRFRQKRSRLRIFRCRCLPSARRRTAWGSLTREIKSDQRLAEEKRDRARDREIWTKSKGDLVIAALEDD